MPHTPYKLVALDLDGTMLRSDGDPDPDLAPVLHKLHEDGVEVVICTGRRWRSALPVVDQLEHLASSVICCGGALIKDATSHETLHSNGLSPALARAVLHEFHQAELVPFLLYDRDLDKPDLLVPHDDRARAMPLSYVENNIDTIEFYRGSDLPLTTNPLLTYTVDRLRLIKEAEEQIINALSDRGFITTLHQPGYPPDQWVIQVHNANATKWNALQWLMKQHTIAADEVLAIGDDVNDIPMLEGAGLSFAPANAVDDARHAADRMTSSNDDGGVLKALEDVFF